MRKSMIVMCSALIIAGAASAGEPPKEGKISGTYHAVGTFKSATLGKDGGLIAGWDETGYVVPREAIFDDRLTWHCFGTYWIISGKHTSSGICVATGLQAGDEFMEQCAWDGMQPVDAKTVTGKCHTIGGTGRYADVRFATSFEVQPSAYKMAAGTNSYVVLSSYEGTCKVQ
jgi:hypothetical protein